jgi:predicted HicB family RNase H-like nuclease
MKKNIFAYNSFVGSVAFSTEDEIFYSKVVGIKELVSYEGNTVSNLKANFHNSVDDYIDLSK